MTQLEITVEVAARFQKELGYKYSNAWPIFLKEDGKKKAFVLIHATDHQEAPKLMRRAYHAIYGEREGTPTDGQRPLFDLPESLRPHRIAPPPIG